ncbi:MAG: radical SAM family heme chaperone HemW [Planctomycetota bacterium]|nr:radical SAM family heme chaperone HemW [Planctomycetota bacterium]
MDSLHENELPLVHPALYVHLPFCVVKCRYCDFFSVTDPSELETYLDALEIELQQRSQGRRFRLIFVGGGTPSFLPPQSLRRFLSILEGYLDDRGIREWTVEANPESLDSQRLKMFVDAGITRLSVGVQSFDNRALDFLGRPHRVSDAIDCVRRAGELGIESINLDLIHSRPGQTLEGWKGELREAIQLSPDHLSCYELTFEAGTALDHDRRQGRISPPDQELQLAFFSETIDQLLGAGYESYEVSNFARPGHRCLHHLHTWSGGEYLGVGVSAVSYLEGVRIANPRNLKGYMDPLLAGKTVERSSERLTGVHRARELLWLGLRMRDGISMEHFQVRTGVEPISLFGDSFEDLYDQGFLETTPGGRLRLTERGWPVLDAVVLEAMGTDTAN